MATGLRSIRTGRRLRRRPTDHQVRDAERQIYSLLGERVARHRQAQAIRSRGLSTRRLFFFFTFNSLFCIFQREMI